MVIEVCVALVRREGRLLVRRRAPGAHLAGPREVPGGERRRGPRGRARPEGAARGRPGRGLGAPGGPGGDADPRREPRPRRAAVEKGSLSLLRRRLGSGTPSSRSQWERASRSRNSLFAPEGQVTVTFDAFA